MRASIVEVEPDLLFGGGASINMRPLGHFSYIDQKFAIYLDTNYQKMTVVIFITLTC